MRVILKAVNGEKDASTLSAVLSFLSLRLFSPSPLLPLPPMGGALAKAGGGRRGEGERKIQK